MFRFIFGIFFVLISLNLFAQDRWDGKDKILHLESSYGLHLVSYGYLHYTTKNSNLTNQILSSTFVFGVGLGKEIYDSGFSYKDLTFNLAGILCGVLISYSYYNKNPLFLVSKNRERYYISCTLRF